MMSIMKDHVKPYSSDNLRQLLIERMNLDMEVEDLTDDIMLEESLGLDSIDLLEIATRLQKTFGIKVSQKNVDAFQTIGSLDAFCMQQLADKEQ
jgi:acyl carrier protein